MNNCSYCRKKKLVLMDCRCKLKQICMLCITNHKCDFDYKINSSNDLEKKLPKIIAIKIVKI